MADNNDVEYKGPGKFTAAVGRAPIEGLVVGAGAGLVGAAIGAIVKSPKTAAKFEEFTKNEISPKLAGAMKGGTIGGAIGQISGYVHGAYKAVKNVNAEKEQLNAVSDELDQTKAALIQQQGFVKALAAREMAEKANPDKGRQ